MEATVKWINGLSFDAELDGFHMVIDGDPEFGGQKKGPKPKGLTLISLAGCTAMDIISILTKMRVSDKIEHFEVATDGTLANEHPKKFEEIVISYIFKGKDLPIQKLKQAIDLSVETYCGVLASLKPGVKISHRLVVNDSIENLV